MSHVVKQSIAGAVVGLMLSVSSLAGDVVKADQLYTKLTTIPKSVVGADGQIKAVDPSVDLQIPFDFNKSELKLEGKLQLDQLAIAFSRAGLENARFEIGGHTDMVGSYDVNMKLSTSRAYAVRDYLNARHGISLSRMDAQGYGYTHLADEKDPKSASNRRVEIKHLIQRPSPTASPAPQTIAQPITPAATPPQMRGGEIIQRPE